MMLQEPTNRLSDRERKMRLVIYSYFKGRNNHATVGDLQQRMNLTRKEVEACITSLLEKELILKARPDCYIVKEHFDNYVEVINYGQLGMKSDNDYIPPHKE
ncbi:hypothetical protein [Alkalicoccus luteus]|uniref:Uncharacterized protein n=1 Tax=Alkalicoccus luteus TaxID=1237094 RepID=A0A969PT32_9BACI|nr:hypothetical protein [Alkalicoccus luteus]NJP39000.1 hypothetical protein [Alkalicoccus luteus]